MKVLLIATLDTKGLEIGFVRERLSVVGVQSLLLDAGSLGSPAIQADISREQVFQAAGIGLAAVQRRSERGEAVSFAALGTAKIAAELHANGEIGGVLAIGGSAGTTIGCSAMRALPVGVPKVMVSTLASGQVSHFVGVRDVFMLHSVTDIAGLNRMSRTILANAAAAIAGMMQQREAIRSLCHGTAAPLVTATMFGVTTPCVERARKNLEVSGFEILVFHATGTGGRTMESLITDGLVSGVLDITTTELADELVGGILTAGADRLTAAGLCGVPQVISLGALDMVNFGPPETVPERFRHRRFHPHNANVTLMRTTPEENDRLGRQIAEKASAARGPTAILVPLRGVSALDAEGKPFHWPEADAALFQSVRNWLSPNVKLIELDLHINDPAFADTAVQTLLDLMKRAAIRK